MSDNRMLFAHRKQGSKQQLETLDAWTVEYFIIVVVCFGVFGFYCLFVFGFRVSLCSLGCPGTCSVNQAGWPWTQEISHLCLPKAGIKSVCHHHPAIIMHRHTVHIWRSEDNFVSFLLSLLHEFQGSNSRFQSWLAGTFTCWGMQPALVVYAIVGRICFIYIFSRTTTIISTERSYMPVPAAARFPSLLTFFDTFATINDPSLRYHNHPKVIIYSTDHSWYFMVYGFEQIYLE